MRLQGAAAVVGVVASVLVLGGRPAAMFMRVEVEKVPLARMIANLTRQVEADPKSAPTHAQLARAHAMAYTLAPQEVEVDSRTGRLWFGYVPKPVPFDPGPRPRSAETPTRTSHLQASLHHYQAALAIEPADLLTRLGFAWMSDHSGDKATAMREYRQVIAQAPNERTSRLEGSTSLAVEAGGYLEKMLDPARDSEELAAIRQRREMFERLPRSVTPLIVPLRSLVAATDLVDRRAAVRFDADGTGRSLRWSWITPDAAWLVFDPGGRGQIGSALQLFGSVTFWMFWGDGYGALAALDDDGDGELGGHELSGLALWHDRNADGASDPGEVQPLAAHRIVALSCRPSRRGLGGDVIAFATDGVTFADGSHRATYDVLLHRASDTTTNLDTSAGVGRAGTGVGPLAVGSSSR